MKKREEYLDLLKGIGIILVVLDHIGMRSQMISNYINSFHMPLFFFAAGVTLSSNKQAPLLFVKKKFLRLIIPYFAYGLLGIIVCFLDSNCTELILNIHTCNVPLWFLRVLFDMYLIWCLLGILCTNPNYVAYIMIGISALFLGFPSMRILSNNMNRALLYGGYIGLGYLYKVGAT